MQLCCFPVSIFVDICASDIVDLSAALVSSDGGRLSADDQKFVVENVFEHHPEKHAKVTDEIDYMMVCARNLIAITVYQCKTISQWLCYEYICQVLFSSIRK